MKDWHLTIAVLVMVMVIVVMTLLSATIPALRPDLTCTPDKERPRGVTVSTIVDEKMIKIERNIPILVLS